MPESEKPPKDITVDGAFLGWAHKVHAYGIVAIPTLALLFGAWYAYTYGVSVLDLSLMLGGIIVSITGISVGYHRLYSHRSFKANPISRLLLGIAGSTAAQGSVSYWATNHRRHHQFTDVPGDLHSPYIRDGQPILGKLFGFWHSHMGWTFKHELTNPLVFSPDLYKDRVAIFVNRYYFLWVALGILVPTAIGGLVTQSWYGAWTAFLWGGVIRLFFTYHFTNFIDSVNHIFGTQPFETRDESRNNVFVAITTAGEGWHNNHHAFPSSAMFGLRWYQFDPGGWLIRFLEFIGWVTDVKVPSPEAIEAKKKNSAPQEPHANPV